MPAGVIGNKRDFHTPLTEGVEGLNRSRKWLVSTIQHTIHIHRYMCEHLRTLPCVSQFVASTSGHFSASGMEGATPGLSLNTPGARHPDAAHVDGLH